MGRAIVPVALVSLGGLAHAQVILVEPGHVLTRHVDSVALLDPSQIVLERPPGTSIESIAVDRATGDLFVQLIDPPLSPRSIDTHVYRITFPGGVTSVCALFTGFGINERGTDMHFDPATGFLVTQDQNFGPPERLATVDCATLTTGTFSLVTTPPIFSLGTFGMQFSRGLAASAVPAGDVVFTSDVAAGGIHSVPPGGAASVTHVPIAVLPGGGDDMVIQPDGDWVWVGDFANGIIAFSPRFPHPAAPSALDLLSIFTAAGLPFVNGSRATVCELSGDLYVSYSGGVGGSAIFRIDEALTTATLILTIGLRTRTEGLQDLIVGPASAAAPGFPRDSLYFTVHDSATGGEQVWECTLPECCAPVPAALASDNPLGINPVSYAIAGADPDGTPNAGEPVMGGTISLFVNASGTTGHTNSTVLGYLRGTTLVLGGGQVLLLDVTIGSELLGLPLVPGDLAIAGAPIPTAPALCGLTFHTQALHIGRVRPFALSNRHILTLGA